MIILSQSIRRGILCQRAFHGQLAMTLACLSRTVMDVCHAAEPPIQTLTKTTSLGTCKSGAATKSKAPTFASVFHAGPYPCTPTLRKLSTKSTEEPPASKERSIEVDFESLISLIEKGEIQLFDVREPDELEVTGRMPGAVNLPLGDVSEAFDLSPEKFQEKYGARKPEKTDTNIVFSCLAGFRSKCALDAAVEKGFTLVRHFPGGWEEWAQRKGLAPPS